jgi:hypothetical protein
MPHSSLGKRAKRPTQASRPMITTRGGFFYMGQKKKAPQATRDELKEDFKALDDEATRFRIKLSHAEERRVERIRLWNIAQIPEPTPLQKAVTEAERNRTELTDEEVKRFRALRKLGRKLINKSRLFGSATLCLAATVTLLIAAADSCGSSKGPSPTKVNKLDASINGYELKVIDVIRDAPANRNARVDAGNHLVRLTVMFINNSSDFQHAASFCCKLKDSTGLIHNSDYLAADCYVWAGIDVEKGANSGPRAICFQAAGDPKAPLTLIWSPSYGNTDIEIALQ